MNFNSTDKLTKGQLFKISSEYQIEKVIKTIHENEVTVYHFILSYDNCLLYFCISKNDKRNDELVGSCIMEESPNTNTYNEIKSIGDKLIFRKDTIKTTKFVIEDAVSVKEIDFKTDKFVIDKIIDDDNILTNVITIYDFVVKLGEHEEIYISKKEAKNIISCCIDKIFNI